MSYIITDDRHYQAIGEALQRKRGEDNTYLPGEMAAAINTIPSTIDGTDLPTQAIYWNKPDDTGRPTEIDIVNWHTDSPVAWSSLLAQNVFSRIKTIKFINCDNISSIVNSAFQNCTSLTSINIPDSVVSIGNSAFQNCTSLTSIIMSNSVTSIGTGAFYNCNKLTDVYYAGSEDDWKKISIGTNNTPLTEATIHYNYSE